MDIPGQFWSQIGVYEIQINGVDVKATIVNRMDQLEKGLSDLRSRIGDLPLVGVDFKAMGSRPDLILMYVKDRCLIIQLTYLPSFPEIIGHFLSDKNLCFLGFRIDSHFESLQRYFLQFTSTNPAARNCLTGNGAEIRKLAALILKNPSLQNCCSLVELASKIGFDMKEEVGQKIEPAGWKAFVFSDEEIKYAINDVSSCYLIGKKLFGML